MRRQRAARAMLVAAGLLNLAPGVGAVAPALAGKAYDVDIAGPDLETLMRHRALLLAVVGGLAVTAAFRPHLRAAAVTTSAVSFGGFTALAMTTAGLNGALTRVAMADVAGLLVLAAGALLGRERA
jgi:hypothetical protein